MKQPPTSKQTPYNSKRDLIKKYTPKTTQQKMKQQILQKKDETQATKSRHRSTSRSKEKEKNQKPTPNPPKETKNKLKIHF